MEREDEKRKSLGFRRGKREEGLIRDWAGPVMIGNSHGNRGGSSLFVCVCVCVRVCLG